MLALHRGGQSSRALAVSRRTRTVLAEELGIDPGDGLSRLELAILRNDQALTISADQPPVTMTAPALLPRPSATSPAARPSSPPWTGPPR